MQSNKWDLNLQDWKKWGKNTLIFSSPAVLAFFIALQNGQTMDFAKGAFFSALLGSGIDLFKKLKAGA